MRSASIYINECLSSANESQIEELQQSAKRAAGTTGGGAESALERAPEVSMALAVALQNTDEHKLDDRGREILVYLKEQHIVHDTIVRNEAALACGLGAIHS